jgi:hypothetical protein
MSNPKKKATQRPAPKKPSTPVRAKGPKPEVPTNPIQNAKRLSGPKGKIGPLGGKTGKKGPEVPTDPKQNN